MAKSFDFYSSLLYVKYGKDFLLYGEKNLGC